MTSITKHGYLVPYKILGLYFKVLNALTKPFRVKKRIFLLSTPPRNIILANPAHIGDVVLASAIIPIIRSNFPDAKINLLVGTWSKKVAQSIPGVDGVLCYRHWKLNRSSMTRWKKLLAYLNDCKNVVKELRVMNIDLAIDLYPYYPNSSILLFFGGVKARIGFNTGGLEFLYTSSIPFDINDKHVVTSYLALLKEVGVNNLQETDLKPSLCLTRSNQIQKSLEGPVVIIHPGSGDEKKLWPLDKWIGLIVELNNKYFGIKIIITGSTHQEQLIAIKLLEYAKDGENLVGQLNWDEFCATVSQANLLIGVDSVAGHVASAYSVPVVIVAAGMSNLNHWKPIGKTVEVLTHALPCSPCYNGRGCEDMKCIREVSVADVLHKIQSILVQ